MIFLPLTVKHSPASIRAQSHSTLSPPRISHASPAGQILLPRILLPQVARLTRSAFPSSKNLVDHISPHRLEPAATHPALAVLCLGTLSELFLTTFKVSFSRAIVYRPYLTYLPDENIKITILPESTDQKSYRLSIEDLQQVTGMTPQQIANHNEQPRPESKEKLREVRSSFYPHSTVYKPSNPSPYMEAVCNGTAKGKSKVLGNRHITPNNSQVNLTRRPESAASLIKTIAANTPKPSSSTTSLVSNGERGTAVIITSRTPQPSVSRLPTIERESSFPRLSQEWKTWMTSQVATLENPVTEPIRLNEAYQPQIELVSHGFEIVPGDVSTSTPEEILAAKRPAVGPRPGLLHSKSEQMIDRFPLLDIGHSAKKVTLEPAQRLDRARSAINLNAQRSPERATRLARMQNSTPKSKRDTVAGSYGPLKFRTTNDISPAKTQLAGTENMVDVFLTSRRRNLALGDESDVFL